MVNLSELNLAHGRLRMDALEMDSLRYIARYTRINRKLNTEIKSGLQVQLSNDDAANALERRINLSKLPRRFYYSITWKKTNASRIICSHRIGYVENKTCFHNTVLKK